MPVYVESHECYPRPIQIGTVTVSGVAQHEECPGQFTPVALGVEGTGIWECPCPCHRAVIDVVESL